MQPREWVLAAGLGFVAGWADVLCVTRFSAFAGQLTGNSVYLGRSMTTELTDILFYTCCIVSNLTGVALFDIYNRTPRHQFQPATAVGFANLAILCLTEIINAGCSRTRWQMMLVCAAMGAQNSVGAHLLGVNTVIVTGNLQKLASGVVKWQHGELHSDQHHTMLIMAFVVVATIVGAFVGAASLAWLDSGDWCFIPIALIQISLLTWYDCSTAQSQPPDPETGHGTLSLNAAPHSVLSTDDGLPLEEIEGEVEEETTLATMSVGSVSKLRKN